MIHVHLATSDDLPAIVDLSNHYARTTAANFAVEPESPAMWRESFAATSALHPWLVAADDEGTFLGFAKSSPWKGRCAYNWSAEVTVYVHPDHHGVGIGRTLYTRLIETLRAQGYRTLLGGITQPNAASVRLHESLGFRKVALFERVGFKFGKWWDVGYWELQLDASATAPAAIRPVAQVASLNRDSGSRV